MKKLIERCPHCGQIISLRKISLIKDMVYSLRKIYKWAIENNRHEFGRKEIKHLFSSENEVAHFGDWVYFGGIFYKQGRGMWGINLERAEKFLKGEIEINTVALKDPVLKRVDLSEPKFVYQVRGLSSFLDENKTYIPEYEPRDNQQTLI